MYFDSEKANVLLLASVLDIGKSDQNNIRVVNIGDGSIKLDTQKELEENLAFLAENLYLDNDIDKKTNKKNYFLAIFICNFEVYQCYEDKWPFKSEVSKPEAVLALLVIQSISLYIFSKARLLFHANNRVYVKGRLVIPDLITGYFRDA